MKEQIQSNNNKIAQADIKYENTIKTIYSLEEKNNNCEAEIQTLLRNLHKSEEKIGEYEKILESAGLLNDNDGINDEQSITINKLTRTKSRLEDEINKIKEENFKQQEIFDERYNNLFKLYDKTLIDKHKQTEIIDELNQEIKKLTTTIIENNQNAWNFREKMREEYIARVSKLRQEKHELQRKIKEMGSRDFDRDLSHLLNPLNEEILNSDDIKENFTDGEGVSFINFEDILSRNSECKKEHLECEQQISMLNKNLEEFKQEIILKDKEICKKNEEIFELQSKLRSSLESPRKKLSFFTRVRANPVVLQLYRD